ncbi:MAG TPA: hypothetical protein VFE48_21040 [Methylomirabilota bacterium]|nr:hypothetical protein [Methylomirabilota bacterium]
MSRPGPAAARLGRALAPLTLLLAFFPALLPVFWPAPAAAQVFIASKPHPDFWIAPLLITANIQPEDVSGPGRPLTLQVSFSVAPPAGKDPAEIAQDIFLLWPGQLVGTDGADGADPALRRQVEDAGFKVLVHGHVRFSARSRAAMGTGAGAAGRRDLGQAAFVTFARPEGLARGARPASLVRIPWKPEMASLDWVPRLELATRGQITDRRVSWLEEAFWGRRNIITLSFGDVGYSSLYPFYFGNRDRVIPLAPDFSRLMVNFAQANHLKIDEVVPATASRRLSETRENTEAFSIPLLAADGIVPQVLKIQFVYFRGRLPWRPILLSALLLGLGNLTGPIVGNALRRLARLLRERVHVGRGEPARKATGRVPGPEALARIRTGEATYDDVVRIVGSEPEEEQRLPTGEIRAMIYRGQRLLPHHGRRFGWFATVTHWDVERQEVQIDFEQERVRDIQARIRRTRAQAASA